MRPWLFVPEHLVSALVKVLMLGDISRRHHRIEESRRGWILAAAAFDVVALVSWGFGEDRYRRAPEVRYPRPGVGGVRPPRPPIAGL